MTTSEWRFQKPEPSVLQNSATFRGNPKYGVSKSCGRKSLENVKGAGRQWVNSTQMDKQVHLGFNLQRPCFRTSP